MDSGLDYWTARDLLEWQVEMGADEAILDAPVNRYELPNEAPDKTPKVAPAAAVGLPTGPPPVPPVQSRTDQLAVAVAQARTMAAAAPDLAALSEAVAAFDHCTLKRGARNCVFSGGDAGARVMIVTEPPDRDEDAEGRPFEAKSGQLFDRMFAAIGLSRRAAKPADALYIVPALPWRMSAVQTASEDDLAMLRPFLDRHIALFDPDLIVLMGNTPCQALLGQSGVTRIRGTWAEVAGKPALPMFHPAYLLDTPEAKRDAWADLLALKARLETLS